MLSTLLLGVVALAAAAALANWRLGLLLCVVVGILQDPIRKVTAGTPAYLSMAFVPIYAAMAINLLASGRTLPRFFRFFPGLMTVGGLFLCCLAISSMMTFSYGLQALPAVLLGLMFYLGPIPAILLGFFFLVRDYRELERPLMFLGGVTSIALVGTVLEYVGVKFADPWLGTVGMEYQWRRWYSSTNWVVMISGFYRSPEVMAWHAATLVILSIYLLVRRPQWAPLWLGQAAWGLICVLLGGRRKMFFLIFIFALLFALLCGGRRRGAIAITLTLALGVAFLVSGYVVDPGYLDTAQSGIQGLGGANTRASGHAATILWLVEMVGLFGYGVGTKAQGTQHLQLLFDVPLVEGGLEKIMVELGLVGLAVVLVSWLVLVRTAYQSYQRMRRVPGDLVPIGALIAFLGGNVVCYLTSFQVYSDPLIGFLLAFVVGLVLSASRLAAERVRAAPPPMVRRDLEFAAIP